MSSIEKTTTAQAIEARLSFSAEDSKAFSNRLDNFRKNDNSTPLRIVSSMGRLIDKQLLNRGWYEQDFNEVERQMHDEVVKPFDIKSASFRHLDDGLTSRLVLHPADQERFDYVANLIGSVDIGEGIPSDEYPQFAYIDFATSALTDAVKNMGETSSTVFGLTSLVHNAFNGEEQKDPNPVKIKLNPEIVIWSGTQFNPRNNRIR